MALKTRVGAINSVRYADGFPGSDLGAQVNAAITDLGATGGTVILPAGTYSITTQITPTSNIVLRGAGRNATILQGNLGGNQVIKIAGTSFAPLSYIHISDLQIQNGTTSSGTLTAGKDGLRADWVNYLTIENCIFTSIQGGYGICIKNSNYVWIQKNSVTTFQYAGIMVLLGCTNIWIDSNLVDTATGLTNGNAYGIVGAAKGETNGDPGAYTSNCWITNNIVRNIPNWEGIDLHGGNHIWITDNKIENCYIGINAALVFNDPAAATVNPSLTNITIRGNKIFQGTATTNIGRAIITNGDGINAFAYEIWVENNKTDGYGSSVVNTLGAIHINFVDGFYASGNSVRNFNHHAFFIQASLNGTITNNIIGDMVASFSNLASAVYFSAGTWNVRVANNSLIPSAPSKATYNFLRLAAQHNHVNLGKNFIKSVQTADYGGVNPPANFTTAPTLASRLNFKAGDRVYDTLGRQGWVGSGITTDGFYSLDTTTVITTANMTNGSPNMTGMTGGTGLSTWYYWLPPGANISVAGAGAAGAALTARVLSNDGTTVVLDTNASTTVTTANVSYQGATVTSTSPAVMYAQSLTPAAVAANTTAEQTFTVTGLATTDRVVVNGPAPTAGTGIVAARVSAANTLALMFSNNTAGSLTPVSGTYNVTAFRS